MFEVPLACRYQVIPDTGPRGLDASVTTDQNPCDKLCRIVGTYDNTLGGVFRTCSWVTCGSLATTTDRLRGAGRVLCGSPQGVDNVAAPLYNLSPLDLLREHRSHVGRNFLSPPRCL